jgi:hypothetical protein
MARSRHKNVGERTRGAMPIGILRQPEPFEKQICGTFGGWLSSHPGGRGHHNPEVRADRGQPGADARAEWGAIAVANADGGDPLFGHGQFPLG